MKEVKEYLAKTSALLPVNGSISTSEAEHRAGEFLSACAHIADLRHMFSEDKIQLLTAQTSTYAEQISKGTAKTITENKLAAEASSEFIKAREELERIENDLSYLKAYADVFNNGHIFYRNMSKGDSY